MPDQELPVTVAVTRPDGSVEHVRVGTAVRQGEGFSLRIGELQIGGQARAPEPRRRAPPGPSGGSGDSPSVFPPYGRSKGAPIHGASVQDLEFYANGARRTLSDPGKARFHDKERALLAVLEAELARLRGEGGGGGGGGDDDGGIPPHGDDDSP